MVEKYKILIVDDEIMMLDVIHQLLIDLGYKTIKLNDPTKTTKIAEKKKPDLVILDWMMPKKDGIEVLLDLKENPETKEIPVIIATGVRMESDDLKKALDLGANDFIRKPLNSIELSARVSSAIKLFNYFKENRNKLDIIHQKEKELIVQKNKSIQQELELKKKELIANALKLIRTSKLTAKLVSELKEATTNLSDYDSKQLSVIISKFSDQTFESHWKEFENRFENLHSQFYENLFAKHPDLTINERKLCAYFRMDMSTKDIVILTFSSYDAIRKARTRLRKKLNLKSDEDLIEYLYHF